MTKHSQDPPIPNQFSAFKVKLTCETTDKEPTDRAQKLNSFWVITQSDSRSKH